MNYIRITKENVDKEHICCAMSGKQSAAKKEWLRQRFDSKTQGAHRCILRFSKKVSQITSVIRLLHSFAMSFLQSGKPPVRFSPHGRFT